MISSYRREGTTVYGTKTLEGNWYEENCRLDVGEKVVLSMMEGAFLRPEEPDISIAPPTRDPGVASNGKLEMPHRSFRSRVTFDSSRQAADDGYLERTSMNQTFFNDPKDREPCPMAYEPNTHGTWGGPIQFDGRTKTRVGPFNRSKNVQLEVGQKADCEETAAKKLVMGATFNRTLAPRVTRSDDPVTGGFGSELPRHPSGYDSRMLTSTAMASWTGY